MDVMPPPNNEDRRGVLWTAVDELFLFGKVCKSADKKEGFNGNY